MKRLLVMVALVVLVVTATFAQWTVKDSARISEITSGYSDVAVSGNSHKFVISTNETTFTRYARLDRSYDTATVPSGGILADMRLVGTGTQRLRVALSLYKDGGVIVNSQLVYLTEGTSFSTYQFRFPSLTPPIPQFNQFKIALSFLEGETGTRELLLDNIRLVNGTDTTLFDNCNKPPIVLPDPLTDLAALYKNEQIVVRFTNPNCAVAESTIIEIAENNYFSNPVVFSRKCVAGVDSMSYIPSKTGIWYYMRGSTKTIGGYISSYLIDSVFVPLALPKPPYNLIASYKNGGILVKYTNPVCLLADSTIVEIADNEGFGNSIRKIKKCVSGADSVFFSPVVLGNVYWARARTKNADGRVSMYSNIDTALAPIDQPPGPPTDLKAFTKSCFSILVKLRNPMDSDLASVIIQASKSFNFSNPIERLVANILSGAMNEVTFSNLTSQTTYYFRAYAVDGGGNMSTYSLIDTAKTLCSTDVDPPGELVTEYTLEQNYPNPFNPVTNITFKLLEQTDVTIEVLNVLGQHIQTLLQNETKARGIHEIQFDGSNLPTGMYFYRIIAGKFSAVKTMVLLK